MSLERPPGSFEWHSNPDRSLRLKITRILVWGPSASASQPIGASLVESCARLIDGLTIDTTAMRRNLDTSGGLILSEAIMMALAPLIGRHKALDVLYDVAMEHVRTRRPFVDLLAAHKLLAPHHAKLDLPRLLDPQAYLRDAAAMAQAAGQCDQQV